MNLSQPEMHVFIDDSGDGGMKIGNGSTSHLVMAACVFRNPREIEHLAQQLNDCRGRCHHRREFRYSKTSTQVRSHFFEAIAPVDFRIRVIMMDKARLYSQKLRSDPSALKAYAVRMLLTKNFGQIRNAKIIIDGHDTKGFGFDDALYIPRMVEREAPGTIHSVKFADSRENVGIQLADMVAGAANHAIRTHKPQDDRYMRTFISRAYQPEGTWWHFCK